MGRTPPQRALDAIDGFFVSLDERFHTAVGQILNVAVDALSCRPRSREHPEADPLHLSTDQETPRDDHETMIIPARDSGSVWWGGCTDAGRAGTRRRGRRQDPTLLAPQVGELLVSSH